MVAVLSGLLQKKRGGLASAPSVLLHLPCLHEGDAKYRAAEEGESGGKHHRVFHYDAGEAALLVEPAAALCHGERGQLPVQFVFFIEEEAVATVIEGHEY